MRYQKEEKMKLNMNNLKRISTQYKIPEKELISILSEKDDYFSFISNKSISDESGYTYEMNEYQIEMLNAWNSDVMKQMYFVTARQIGSTNFLINLAINAIRNDNQNVMYFCFTQKVLQQIKERFIEFYNQNKTNPIKNEKASYIEFENGKSIKFYTLNSNSLKGTSLSDGINIFDLLYGVPIDFLSNILATSSRSAKYLINHNYSKQYVDFIKNKNHRIFRSHDTEIISRAFTHIGYERTLIEYLCMSDEKTL